MNKSSMVMSAIAAIAMVTSANAQVTLDAFKDAGYFAAGFADGVPQVTDRNIGTHVFIPVGHANNDRVNRSVFQFDIMGNVPSGATITSATFEFEVQQQGGLQGQTGADFSLHRVTTAWDEGTGFGQQGSPSGDGATWAMATGTVAWTTLGGDFDAMTSGTVFVDGPTSDDVLKNPADPVTYSISSAKLIQDIQDIVDGSVADNGFLLKGASEDMMLVAGSAARVSAREGGNAAKLVIDYDEGGVLIGDVNMDGSIDLLDVGPFVDLRTSNMFQAEADINQDGNVDLLDVGPFVDLLTGN